MPKKEYTIDSIARGMKTHPDIVLRYIKRFSTWPPCSLNGKPISKEVFGVKVNQQTGRYEYISHNTVIKDLDPEEGLSWPLEVEFLSIADVYSSGLVAGQDVTLQVEVEYCFTVPARIWVGIPYSNGLWLTSATDVLVGNGSKTYRLAFKASAPQQMKLNIKALHQHDDLTWELSDQLDLDLSIKERCTGVAPALAVAASILAPLLIIGLAKTLSSER